MKYAPLLLFLFLNLNFLNSESTNSSTTKAPKNNKDIDVGLEFLEKKIKLILPLEVGFRKDLYDFNGNLLHSEYLNSEGDLLEIEPGFALENRNYNSAGFLESIQILNKEKKISSKTSFLYDTECLQIKKDESCATEISFFDGENRPIENEDGIHTYQTEFDLTCLKSENRKISDCKKSEKRLNKKKKLTADKDGNAKVVRTFDSTGNLNLHEIYDKFGKIKQKAIYAYNYQCIELTNKPQGCIILYEYSNRIKLESNNNNSSSLNYGKKIIQYDLNCIKEKKISEKCISLEENYDVNGKPYDLAEKFTFGCIDYSLELGAYAKKITNFDKRGNEVLKEFYNSKNELIEDSSGGAKYTYAYNQECMDNGNKPQYCKTLSEVYDKQLKLKYKAIYDENCVKSGKAIMESPNYCTAWKESYDSINAGKGKILITKADFDKEGFKTNVEHYNINGKLDFKTIYYFDKEKLVKKENQNTNGKLIEDSDGIAIYKYSYGNEKFTTMEESLDKDGKLKANPDGIARMVFQYNENCLRKKNNRYECTILEEYYDENENLMNIKINSENTFSYAKKVREFDNVGNLILEAYYDKNLKPCKNQNGISKYIFQYDKSGEITEETVYGKKTSPKQKILYEYDPKCKLLANDFSCNTSITHLNKKNQLVNKDIINGFPYAKEITTYNPTCIKITSEPDDCFEKKEYLNSKKEIVYAEYFQYLQPPSPKSEIKLVKLKLTQNKTPFSVEFIK